MLVLIGACRRVAESTRANKTRHTVESYGLLELTTQTRHANLRDELSRLAGEDATPAQMTPVRIHPADSLPGWRRAGEFLADPDNVAIGIAEAFPERSRAALRRRLDEQYPRQGLPDDPQKFVSLRRILEQNRAERDAYRRALARPECEFGFPWTQGLLADFAAIEAALLGNRLLGIEAIVAIAADDPIPAVEIVPLLFRAARLVDDIGNATARISAARMRSEAFRIVELVARHPKTRPEDFDTIYRLLAADWAGWPDESQMWIGERAIGLHAYEMVRDGQLLSLLSFEELARVREAGLEQYCARTYEHVDEDEWYYLRTMRGIIERCHEPYVLRKEANTQIANELAQNPLSEQYPRVAALLLKDLDWSQRIVARDRALFEGWSIAFALATGRTVPTDVSNPLTGRAYKIVEQPKWIEVSGVDVPGDDWPPVTEPLVVPRVTVPATATISSP